MQWSGDKRAITRNWFVTIAGKLDSENQDYGRSRDWAPFTLIGEAE
jgi:hypothetical protein